MVGSCAICLIFLRFALEFFKGCTYALPSLRFRHLTLNPMRVGAPPSFPFIPFHFIPFSPLHTLKAVFPQGFAFALIALHSARQFGRFAASILAVFIPRGSDSSR